MKILKYWERHNTRRPFPALYEAKLLYGFNCIDFKAPVYYEQNKCPWCGNKVNNKRRKYCSDDCAKQFQNATVWNRRRDSYSLRILYRDKFICQKCGELHVLINEHGIYIPIDDGMLVVHHIIPVSKGGSDHPDNLITLCRKCHKQIHKEMKNESQAKVD
jgi:5-methylcytosine-specific restriction endonuclease McrA